MTRTLYDILDVRPDDDVGRVKEAFRKAAKTSHPDLNVGDPDAPARFTQIVRANAILSDPELRAIYDRMLEFERQQFQPASKRTTILDAPHNFVTDAIVVVVLAVVLAGAYTLFTYTPEISIAKVKAVADTAYKPSNVAAVRPSPTVEANTRDSLRDKLERAEVPAPSAVASTANSGVAVEDAAPAPSFVALTAIGNVVETIPSNGLAPSPSLKHARFYREQGVASYSNGDFPVAIADFDPAIRLDPKFEDAYIDRGIVLYCMRKFNRAFADVAQAMRIENSHRTASPPLPKARPVFCTRSRGLVRHGQTRPSILRPSPSSQYCSK